VLASAALDPWLSRYDNLSRLFLVGDGAGGNMGGRPGWRRPADQGRAPIGPLLPGPEPRWRRLHRPGVPPVSARTWSFICAGRYLIDHPYADPLLLPASSWQRLGASRVLVTGSTASFSSPPYNRTPASTVAASVLVLALAPPAPPAPSHAARAIPCRAARNALQ
jgi:hypothetical protein